MPRRVLLVSYTYPPAYGSGGIRISKFAKYLPEFGWDPIVLTVDPVHYPFKGGLESLVGRERVVTTGFFDPLAWPRKLYPMESTPAGTAAPAAGPSIVRRLIRSVRPAAKYIWDLVYFPDPQIGWYPYAMRAGRRILQEQPVDAILSSSPPPTDHLVGAALAREFGVPWVADYRDPWSDIHTYKKYWPMGALDLWLERRTLKGVSAAVTISPTLARRLSDKLGKPVEVIANGFDPADMPPPDPAPDGPFILVHAGTLYRNQREPGLVFEGLKLLKQKQPVDRNRLQVHFVGVRSELALEHAEKHGVSDLVVALKREPYADVLRRQSKAAALLLLGLNDPMGGGVLTGKIFEYFGLRRPILGAGAPDADLEDLIRRTGTGRFVSTAAGVADTLADWMREKERTGAAPYAPYPAEIDKYTRRGAAEKLAAVLSAARQV